jgi:COMPASS component SWD3
VSNPPNPYQILGLQPGAPSAEVKAAYRKLARQWHPDQFQSPPQKAEAEAKIKQINGAYDQLKGLAPGQVWSGSKYHKYTATAATAAQPSAQADTSVQRGGAAQRQERAHSLYRQALTLQQVERFQEATNALSQAIKLQPDYAEAYRLRARLYELRGFERLSQRDSAIAASLGLERAYQASAEMPEREL